MSTLTVKKGRTVTVPVSLGRDVSGSEFFSDIRVGRTSDTDLIASWEIAFDTDGTDGELIFTLDDSVTSLIEQSSGYMDIKEVKDGEPLPVEYNPIEVVFTGVITP